MKNLHLNKTTIVVLLVVAVTMFLGKTGFSKKAKKIWDKYQIGYIGNNNHCCIN